MWQWRCGWQSGRSALTLSLRLPLAEIHRRNVHVFNSSNGAELAGLTDVTVRLLSTPGRVNINVHRLDQSTMLHSYQMGSVSMPFNNSCAWVARHLIPAIGTSFNLGVTSYSPCLLVSFSVCFVVHAADMTITGSAQVIVYLATDVPHTRAYSVNNTHTPHVRLRATAVSHFRKR